MIKEHQRRSNVGVGLGILFNLIALQVLSAAEASDELGLYLMAVLFGTAGSAFFIWGCVNYAQGKGYSGWWGLLGLLSIFGLLALVLMRDRYKDGRPPVLPPTNPPPESYPPPPGSSS